MKSVAIIPARGGSKRVPRKNIKHFHGKPMIAWAIEMTQRSDLFEEIIVSTDDSEIAEIATTYGANVPFMRPASLSNDFASTIDVIEHAVSQLQQDGLFFDFACCIYATAPLLQADDVLKGLIALNESDADYAYAVTDYDYAPHRALEEKVDGELRLANPELATTRSQDLPTLRHDAGQFYWARTATWLSRKEILASRGVGVLIPRSRCQDIDTLDDWKIAEALFFVQNEDLGL
jgi:pseudaminic acid cytidylyltransferase